MKVTGVPVQTGLADAEMTTPTASPGFTVTGKVTVVPVQLPATGVIRYVTIPGVAPWLVKTWSIVVPEPDAKPLTVPEVSEAVQ